MNMPYADKNVMRIKQREAHLRRMQNPEYAEKIRLRSLEYARSDHGKLIRIAAYKRRWSDLNYRSKCATQSAKWYMEHPQKRREVDHKYRARNLETRRAYSRRWHKEHRAERIVYEHKKRAKKMLATVNPRNIAAFITAVRSKKTATCYYCQKLVPVKIIHFDHIVALANGGSHSVENLCVSCARCNQTKWRKTLSDFVTLGQQLLAL